jgi:RND family efflux transporter MFP subunit
VNVKVGDTVSAGEVLVKVDDTDLRIRLQKQLLSLRRAELALDEALKGPKDASRLRSENDLERAYEDRINAEEDLKTTIDEGYNAVADAFLDLPSVINDLDDILGNDYLSNNIIRVRYGSTAVEYKDEAESQFRIAEEAYDDVLDKYRAASRQSDQETIKTLILDTYEATKNLSDAIKVTRNLTDYVEREADDSVPAQLPLDQADLDGLTRDINTHVVSLFTIKNSITQAEQDINDAKRIIGERDASNSDLLDTDEFEVENARIDVQQAQLDVQDIQAEIEKRSIKSPMDGIVTDIVAKRGETISPGSVAVAVISASNFQVSANLPEIDVAKVKAGLQADVTLDAYGSEVNFPMVVTSISLAEDIVEGVAVYELILQFVKADERIKSGLTADITVKSERRDNVLAVPQRAVIARKDGKFVQILEGETTVDKKVTTGLRGSDGNLEITSGLNEGDQVLVFSESE